MPKISFQTTLFSQSPDQEVLLRLPLEASEQLPSRGIVMVEGTINTIPFKEVLEPDGNKSHWFKVSPSILKTAKVGVGDTVNLEIESTSDWIEPKLPADLQKVLNADPETKEVWQNITPMARWDWVRWALAPKQAQTRQKRVESIPSRFRAGKYRVCCFDRTQCTLTEA